MGAWDKTAGKAIAPPRNRLRPMVSLFDSIDFVTFGFKRLFIRSLAKMRVRCALAMMLVRIRRNTWAPKRSYARSASAL